MPSGSVLMSSRAPIGYVAVAANPISTNQGFKSFLCAEDLAPEFVAYWLRYIRPLLEQMRSGTTFSEISGSRAKEIPLHFAPLAEQKRIVEKIHPLLASVEAAHERLTKVAAILRRSRQSVLAAAFPGRSRKSLGKSVICTIGISFRLNERRFRYRSARSAVSCTGGTMLKVEHL